MDVTSLELEFQEIPITFVEKHDGRLDNKTELQQVTKDILIY